MDLDVLHAELGMHRAIVNLVDHQRTTAVGSTKKVEANHSGTD